MSTDGGAGTLGSGRCDRRVAARIAPRFRFLLVSAQNKNASVQLMYRRAHQYRRRAIVAKQQAADATTPTIEQQFEVIAEHWLALAEQVEWMEGLLHSCAAAAGGAAATAATASPRIWRGIDSGTPTALLPEVRHGHASAGISSGAQQPRSVQVRL